MSDELQELGYQMAQEVEQPSEKPEVPQPKYVTEESLEAIVADRVARELQRQTDKDDSRIEKKLTKWVEKLEKRGIKVTNEMMAKGREQLALDELANLRDEDEVAQPVRPAAQGPFTPEAVAKVQARMVQLQAEHGVSLQADDDEYGDLPWLNPKPERFLAKFEEALKAKKARLEGQGTPTEPTNPIARVAVTGGGATANVETLTTELGRLNSKTSLTPAEDKRRRELTTELEKQLSR